MAFISEPITPFPGTFDVGMMSQGLAALPAGFTWREKRYRIEACLEHVKQSSREGGTSSGEQYLRRQEFLVTLDSGQEARLYVLRNVAPSGAASAGKKRWFLYSIASSSSRPW